MERFHVTQTCIIRVERHLEGQRETVSVRVGSEVVVEAMVFLNEKDDVLKWTRLRSTLEESTRHRNQKQQNQHREGTLEHDKDTASVTMSRSYLRLGCRWEVRQLALQEGGSASVEGLDS